MRNQNNLNDPAVVNPMVPHDESSAETDGMTAALPKQSLFGENGAAKYTPKNQNRRHDVITMIICVLLAFGIWCYVMNVDSPSSEEVFSNVMVGVENNASDSSTSELTAISGDGTMIEVTLKGRKTVLNKLTDEDISAYVDISEISSAGKHTFPISINAPAGTSIVDYSPKEVDMYVDRKGSRQVDVEVRLQYQNLSSDYYIGEKKPSYDSITVSGPQTELDQITSARLTLKAGEIKTSFSGSGDLELVDRNGNVISSKYLTMSTVNISAEVIVCTEKTVKLTSDFKNQYLNSSTATVTIAPRTVKIKGPVETLETLSELNVTTLDETTLQENKTYHYPLSLPEGVELSDPMDDVELSIALKNCYTKTVSVSDVTIRNAPSGKNVDLPQQTLKITVRGNSANVMDLTEANFTVTVDLSENDSLTNGNQFVTATVAISGGDSAAAYVWGTYQVEIDVS